MTLEQSYHAFWQQFGWAVFDENTTPENAELPRITYSVSVADLNEPFTAYVSLWDKSYSWESVTAMARRISEIISRGGAFVTYDDGHIWIKRGEPEYMRMNDPDDAIRRIIYNLEIEYIPRR